MPLLPCFRNQDQSGLVRAALDLLGNSWAGWLTAGTDDAKHRVAEQFMANFAWMLQSSVIDEALHLWCSTYAASFHLDLVDFRLMLARSMQRACLYLQGLLAAGVPEEA